MTDLIDLVRQFMQLYRNGITDIKELLKAFFIEIAVGLGFLLIAIILPSPRGKVSSIVVFAGIIISVHSFYCLIVFGLYYIMASICRHSHDSSILACDEEIENTNAFWISSSITIILGVVLCIISGNKTSNDGMYWDPIFIVGIGIVLFSIISIIKRLKHQRTH